MRTSKPTVEVETVKAPKRSVFIGSLKFIRVNGSWVLLIVHDGSCAMAIDDYTADALNLNETKRNDRSTHEKQCIQAGKPTAHT
jgi:hypothetical protein